MLQSRKGSLKKTDMEFQDKIVQKVEESGRGWSITTDDGWSFYVPPKSPVRPKRGMRARFYGAGIGSPVRGLYLAGKKIFYRTPKQEDEKHRRWCRSREAEERFTAMTNQVDTNRRVAALPKPLRLRIERFSVANPNFCWKFESYELFCCEEAVKIQDMARASSKTTEERLVWMKTYYDATEEQRRRMAPGVGYEKHSANTFGVACALARSLIEKSDSVPNVHGALAPLVGCVEYGCEH